MLRSSRALLAGCALWLAIASARRPAGATTQPPLEAVTLGGRTVVLYSKYDWSCALEGDNPYASRGYVDEDGRRLALNIFHYAISY